ncbi:MAG TPA: SNF2-related protein, partial [Pseudomonadota bacterium]|nr:SNF2-related protein [Pseudomonadota bacterium]
DRARAIGSPRAQVQLQRLLTIIGPATLEEAAPAIREGWVPVQVTQLFLASFLKIEVPALEWRGALLRPVGIPYSQLESLAPSLQIVLGYCNHDLRYFSPPYEKRSDPSTGDEESAEAALDRARVAYGDAVAKAFQQWLGEHSDSHEEILTAYKRKYRGYVVPHFPPDRLPIARWGNRITPKPHQLSGAWRLIRSNGGLLAYDVGVGKTLTGIATVAYLRQIGRARRPLVVVPNSIIWKWHREISRALPDYRIAVIGSVRYLGRNGIYRSRLDDPTERQRKWTEFQLGLYDVAICTYSVFGTTRLSEEAIRQFVEETPALLRSLGLKAAKLQEDVDNLDKLYRKRRELATRVEKLAAEVALAGGSAQSFSESDDVLDDEEDDQNV